jgi:hypothetical protein
MSEVDAARDPATPASTTEGERKDAKGGGYMCHMRRRRTPKRLLLQLEEDTCCSHMRRRIHGEGRQSVCCFS